MHRLMIVLLLGVVVEVAAAQRAPLVVTKQAPLCTTPLASCDSTDLGYFNNFVHYELPFLSGIGTQVLWASIDDCSTTMAPCQESNTDGNCPPHLNDFTHYFWCNLDQALLNYISNSVTSFANKKIVLILQPTNDQMTNNANFTPKYVFTPTWASNVPSPICPSGCNPQDVVVCKSWPGDTGSGTGCPAQAQTTGPLTSTDYVIWNATACFPNGNYSCNPCSPITDVSGFPILYEPPFLVAYQDFLAALAHHYNSVTGSPYGKQIAPYIAYVRVGMANADENLPACTSSSNLQQDTWAAHKQFPAGYIVNSGNTQYVATGAGMSSSTTAMPTCSPAGCTTAPDNTIPGWYNAGQYTQQPPNLNAIWPGPTGQFTTLVTGDPNDYWDNGYLSQWSPLANNSALRGTPGYIASMLTFLKGLGASFPFDISSHTGPPGNSNTAYADSEAAIASTNGVGFGMESVNIGDTQAYLAQVFPTTREDWAHNFQTYSAPVHHLQMSAPGTKYYAEGYAIAPVGGVTIISGVATINCTNDCTPFGGQLIYVSGNSNNALNGIWQVTCGGPSPQPPCPVYNPPTSLYYGLTFTPPSGASCSSACLGGNVYGPDYWPIALAFALQHGSNFIEVWECSLDYAFGADAVFPPQTTTDWVSPGGTPQGCANWALLGGDPGYLGTLSDALIGQPAATSVRTGNSILVNGTQF